MYALTYRTRMPGMRTESVRARSRALCTLTAMHIRGVLATKYRVRLAHWFTPWLAWPAVYVLLYKWQTSLLPTLFFFFPLPFGMAASLSLLYWQHKKTTFECPPRRSLSTLSITT